MRRTVNMVRKQWLLYACTGRSSWSFMSLKWFIAACLTVNKCTDVYSNHMQKYISKRPLFDVPYNFLNPDTLRYVFFLWVCEQFLENIVPCKKKKKYANHGGNKSRYSEITMVRVWREDLVIAYEYQRRQVLVSEFGYIIGTYKCWPQCSTYTYTQPTLPMYVRWAISSQSYACEFVHSLHDQVHLHIYEMITV